MRSLSFTNTVEFSTFKLSNSTFAMLVSKAGYSVRHTENSSIGHLGDMSGIPHDSGMGRTVGFGHSSMGHLGHVWDIPSSPGTLGWEGQRDLGTLAWDTWDMFGLSHVVLGLGGGKGQRDLDTLAWDTGDMSGISQVVPTLGWEGQWDLALPWDTWDIPHSPGTLGWEGQRDLGTLAWDTWTCLVYPMWSWDSGMGRTVGFGHSIYYGTFGTMSRISQVVPGLWDGKYSHFSMGHLGHVWDIPSSPGMAGFGYSSMGQLGHVWDIPSSPRTLGWEGQRDLGTLVWDTLDMSGISQIVPGLWEWKDSGIWALYYGTLGTYPQ